MINRINEIVPTSIAARFLPAYVYLNKVLRINYVTYTASGQRIRLTYERPEHFKLVYNMIDQEQIVSENLSLGYLEAIDQCDAFVDVGAYHGLYSIIAGKLYNGTNIFSFEPNDYNRQILTEILDINQINAEIREEIVTDASGKTEFYERNHKGSQGHSTSEYQEAEKTVKECVALSDFLAEYKIKNPYIKLDAEGEEYKILKDVMDHADLSSIRGIVEIHPDKMDVEKADIIELFEQREYEWRSLGDTTGPGYSPRPAYYFSSSWSKSSTRPL